MLSQAHPTLRVHLCKDYETLQQQWMSLFATQRPIFWTEITPQSWQFVCTLRVLVVRNGMV